MNVIRYMVEDDEGNALTSYVYEEAEYQEAKSAARATCGQVVAYEFEFADSYVVDDFTPTKEDDNADAHTV